MEQLLGEIALNYTDDAVNSVLRTAESSSGAFTRHFNQSEDFFLRVPKPFIVPNFPIHHDVREHRPSRGYVRAIRQFVEGIVGQLGPMFQGLAYYFDPAEILRPSFFRLYRIREQSYLYMLRVDLTFKPMIHEVVEKGSNDVTPSYSSHDLFVEADFIPLDEVMRDGDSITGFKISQSVSQTWIGETGRGYFVQGIWLDHELTKFLSKLFLPQDKRVYPYYPVNCKYRAICHSDLGLTPDRRKRWLPVLHLAREFLYPYMEQIQDALREQEFSESLAAFTELKKRIPLRWQEAFRPLSVRRYLNDAEQREFVVEFQD